MGGRCNCSICRRTGSLTAYFPDDGSVRVEGETARYVWGDRMIEFHHCPLCACHSHWETTGERYGRMGVNARLLDGYSEHDGRSLFEGREDRGALPRQCGPLRQSGRMRS